MRLSYFPLLLLLTTYGCGGDGRSTPSVLQIGGQWSFTESYTDTSLSTTCTNQATVTFAQNGSNFSGSSVQTGTVRCNGVVGGVGLRCQGYVADDSLT